MRPGGTVKKTSGVYVFRVRHFLTDCCSFCQGAAAAAVPTAKWFQEKSVVSTRQKTRRDCRKKERLVIRLFLLKRAGCERERGTTAYECRASKRLDLQGCCLFGRESRKKGTSVVISVAVAPIDCCLTRGSIASTYLTTEGNSHWFSNCSRRTGTTRLRRHPMSNGSSRDKTVPAFLWPSTCLHSGTFYLRLRSIVVCPESKTRSPRRRIPTYTGS